MRKLFCDNCKKEKSDISLTNNNTYEVKGDSGEDFKVNVRVEIKKRIWDIPDSAELCFPCLEKLIKKIGESL